MGKLKRTGNPGAPLVCVALYCQYAFRRDKKNHYRHRDHGCRHRTGLGVARATGRGPVMVSPHCSFVRPAFLGILGHVECLAETAPA